MEMTLEKQFLDEMNFHKRTIVKRLYEKIYSDLDFAAQKMVEVYTNDKELFEQEYKRAWEILKDDLL